jgi:hypothetical protein
VRGDFFDARVVAGCHPGLTVRAREDEEGVVAHSPSN